MKERQVQTTPIVPVPCLPPDLVPPQGFLAELRTAYSTPRRAYHGWPHVARVLEHVGEVADGPGWERPREAWLAALFHDAVYIAGAKDNEARSAALARDAIPRWFPDESLDGRDLRPPGSTAEGRCGLIDIERVAALVELTARHGSLRVEDVDRDAALLLDCDTAVLGAPADEFDRYDAGIAEEYREAVPVDAYRAGRRMFLVRLLEQPRIFLSDWFHQRLDPAARVNLRRAIEKLAV